jgi:hypothetical protein
MRTFLRRSAPLSLLLVFLTCDTSQTPPLNAKISAATFRPDAAATRANAIEAYNKLPLRFEINQGQADPSVKFISRNGDSFISLAADGVSLRLRGGSASQPASIRMNLVKADPNSKIGGVDELPGRSNYLK